MRASKAASSALAVGVFMILATVGFAIAVTIGWIVSLINLGLRAIT